MNKTKNKAPQAVEEPKRVKKPRVSRRDRAERRKTGVFMLPSFFGIMMFFIVPFVIVIYYSLIDGNTSANFVGLQNYENLLNNSAFKMAMKNTGVFSLTAVPAVVILALLLAVLLDANVPYKSTFRTIFLSPMIVPAASVILIWQVLFDYNGVVNDITCLFGADPVEWLKSDFGYIVVVLLFLWKNIGYNMIMFMSALAAVPRGVLEVAMLDGCGPVRRFFSIKLRYLASTVTYVTIMSLINSFKVFREVYLLTGDYPYESMYTLQHFMNNTFQSFDYQKLSSAAVVLCLIMIAIIGIMLWADDRIGKGIEE